MMTELYIQELSLNFKSLPYDQKYDLVDKILLLHENSIQNKAKTKSKVHWPSDSDTKDDNYTDEWEDITDWESYNPNEPIETDTIWFLDKPHSIKAMHDMHSAIKKHNFSNQKWENANRKHWIDRYNIDLKTLQKMQKKDFERINSKFLTKEEKEILYQMQKEGTKIENNPDRTNIFITIERMKRIYPELFKKKIPAAEDSQ